MDRDLSPLDDALADRDLDGYLLDADYGVADQRYLSGVAVPDPFVTLYADGKTAVLVSGMEVSRVETEGRADAVRRWRDYDYRERVAEHGRPVARNLAVADFCEEFGVEAVGVPERFPVWTADGLRERGVAVDPDPEGLVADLRAVKTAAEVECVREAQRANEAAMSAAESLLADADVRDGVLHHGGEVLTSERVKATIEETLLHRGCGLDDTIVACGADGAEPHNRGSGPLRAGEPVVVDVFPRDKDTHYHADMTRTFVRGEPSDEATAFYEATARAQDAALDAIEAGVTGEAVHDAVCDVYEDAGYPTLRADEDANTGFIHTTGHGVGLEVHESPRLGPGGEELEVGNVVTVEPGLYDPDVGGVRIEDLVVVTEDGYENLTDYPREFVLG